MCTTSSRRRGQTIRAFWRTKAFGSSVLLLKECKPFTRYTRARVVPRLYVVYVCVCIYIYIEFTIQDCLARTRYSNSVTRTRWDGFSAVTRRAKRNEIKPKRQKKKENYPSRGNAGITSGDGDGSRKRICVRSLLQDVSI